MYNKRTKQCYEQLSKTDLENLMNTSLDLKERIKAEIAKIIKDLDYEYSEDLSLPDKSFGEFVRIMNIKVNLTNLLNDLDTGIKNYIELEKSAFKDK